MNTEPAGQIYLTERGITQDTLHDLAPIYVTPDPSEEELTDYKIYLREARLNGNGTFRKMREGLIIPYLTIAESYRPFGRCRVLNPTEQLIAYYAKHGEECPKFLSPSKSRLKDQPGAHLYLLPHDAGKMGKSKDVLLLTEGEVKAAAISQHARHLDDANNSYVTIGAGGVQMFLCTPEWEHLQIKDRRVFLLFDADSFDKKEVMQAEIKLALACITKGARVVRSCWWSPEAGKGIDDYLVHQSQNGADPKEVIKVLLCLAVSPFHKYADPPLETLQPYQLDSLCAEIVKQPLKPFQYSMIAKDLADGYKDQGIGIKEIRRELDAARARQREKDQEHQETPAFSQEFGIDYTPRPLENFDLHQDHLYFKERPLCKMFVISKYVYTEDPDKEDTYLLSFRNKTLLLPSGVQSSYKDLAKVFNRNQEILFDGSAKLIQQYISQYWLNHQDQIQKVPLFENTGWNRDGFFQLPGITKARNQAVYTSDMERKFTPHGERAEHYEFTEEMLTRHKAGLITVLGFATPCLGLFNLPRYAVVIYGGPGSGKTKSCEVAISQYGDPEHLMFSMDSTKVGKEITFSLYRDLPIILDEFNTASNDGRKIAQSVIETIYGFYQGKGRTRATVQINHREIKEFRGLVFLTSERSLESIFSVVNNMRIGGAYRRTLEIPIVDVAELWSIAQESETQFFSRIHNHIRTHYGFVGLDWLLHISDKEVQDRLAFAHDEALKLLIEKGQANLKGTERLIALLWAVMTELEIFLQIPDHKIHQNLAAYLNVITERQQRQIDTQITDEVERFKDSIENFITMHPTCFEGICPEKAVMSQIYGKVHYTETLTHIYLRAGAFKLVCNEYGFERDTLLPKLESKGLVRKKEGKWYFPMSISNTKGQVYYFLLPSEETTILHDVKDTYTTTQNAD